ncbi:MAG: aspartyl protease family protein [Mangrovibacterium sp.]
MQRKPILPLLILALACLSFSNPDVKTASEQTMQQYRSCLVNANKKLVKEITSPSFRAGIYQQPHAADMFRSFIDFVQMPDSMYWGDLQQEDGESFRMVNYVFGEKEMSSKVYFAPDGKLLFSDWIDQRGMGMNRKQESHFVAAVPFYLDGSKIIIPATLNKSARPLRMLFDTGADGMALVKSLQEDCEVKITKSHTANVPGGQMQVNMSEGNTLVLDSLEIPNQNLVLFENIGEGIDGIIGGSNLFRNFITEVDFENHLIKLYRIGDFEAPSEYQATPMSYASGVPTVPLHMHKDGKHFECDFIFDTGAGYSAILFGSGMKQLENDSIYKTITPQYASFNKSLGGSAKIYIGQTDSLVFANMNFPNASLAMEPYNPNNHARHEVLGSIGIKSLSRMNWIVDLVSYQIYTTPNSYTTLPMDFIFEGYLLGYEGKQLKVLRPVSKETNENLKVGDEILKLGKYKAEELDDAKLTKSLATKKLKLKVLKPEGEEATVLIEN